MLEVEKIGGVTAWADNVDKAIEILASWGAIRTNIKM
jgi:hypothetical protein